MKPKRVGTTVSDYTEYNKSLKMKLVPEKHPVYEYRGYYIVRGYSIANTPSSTYYSIHEEWDGTRASKYVFSMPGNNDDCQSLGQAVLLIDWYLEETRR